jgi:hypothetical protein
MSRSLKGNILLGGNFPSGTAYVWWLMEHFWSLLAVYFVENDRKAFVAYPEITELSEAVQWAPVKPVEFKLPWAKSDERKKALKFIRDNNIGAIYFTVQSYLSCQHAFLRINGVKTIVVYDHTPGDRLVVTGRRGPGETLYLLLLPTGWYVCRT